MFLFDSASSHITDFPFGMAHRLHMCDPVLGQSEWMEAPGGVHFADFRAITPTAALCPQSEVRLHLPLLIFKVQDNGGLHLVMAFETFDLAKATAREVGKIWPREFVIDNEETGELMFVSTRDERNNQ